MRIFLVRHGESDANVDPDTFQTEPDYAVHLTARGKEQAAKVGEFLATFYTNNNQHGKYLRVWNSPYERARETSDIVYDKLRSSEGGALEFHTRREDERLREIDFGLWAGLNPEQVKQQFPQEYGLHTRQFSKPQGRYYAKYSSMGESQAEVTQRLRNLFAAIYRDWEHNNIEDLVIVTHGKPMNLFVAAWMGYPIEWINGEPNPNNCAVRMIEGTGKRKWKDHGYMYIPGEAKDAEKLIERSRENLEKNPRRAHYR